jgi:hypothetical protein
MRIELLEKREDGFHTVGLYKLVSDSFFELVDLDHGPRLVSGYTLNWDWVGEKTTLTHIGFFPDMEYTGVVSELTAPLEVKDGQVVSFRAGSITMAMNMDVGSGITVIKGEA